MNSKSARLDREDRVGLLFRAAAEQKLGVVLLFEGTGIAGILTAIQDLTRVLDPRHYDVHHFPEKIAFGGGPRPFLWQDWRKLPRAGSAGIFDGSYYHRLAGAGVKGEPGSKRRKQLLDEILNFERTLADNGYLVLKIHVARDYEDLRKDLKKEQAGVVRKSLLQKRTRKLRKHFADYRKALRRIVRRTDVPYAPWFEPTAASGRETSAAVFDYLIARLEEALELDSRVAVVEFDRAMDHLRSLRAGATAVLIPEPEIDDGAD